MKVFNKGEEQLLKGYCITPSKMLHGLRLIKLRDLTFEFAMRLKHLPHSKKGCPNT